MAERICYFQEPLDRLFVTLPCGCPFLSSVCTGWLGSPAWLFQGHLSGEPGMNLASRSDAMVPTRSRSLWPQRVGTVGRGQMSQEGMGERCIF